MVSKARRSVTVTIEESHYGDPSSIRFDMRCKGSGVPLNILSDDYHPDDEDAFDRVVHACAKAMLAVNPNLERERDPPTD